MTLFFGLLAFLLWFASLQGGRYPGTNRFLWFGVAAIPCAIIAVIAYYNGW